MSSKNSLCFLRVLCVAIFLVGLQGCSSKPTPQKELHVLAWVGYDEPEIVEPFQSKTGIKVQTETFLSADKMFAKLSSSPNSYDVVVVDPEYIAKLHAANLLLPLDPNDFDFSNYVEPLNHFPLCWIDNKLYAVLIKYGVNGIVYNKEKLTKDDVSSYDILWSKKVTGKVGLWDWYLPNMGVLSLSSGFSDPYHLGPKQFDVLKNRMKLLRPQVRAILGNFAEINSAFSRGDIWIAPALGEHTAAILSEQGFPIDWTVPKQGAIMWIETLGIPPGATNKSDAIQYIRYMQTPEVQAKLTWRRAYRANIPSIKGIELLTSAQQNALKVHNGAEAQALVQSLHVRNLPTDLNGASMEQTWQSAWQEFKAQH